MKLARADPPVLATFHASWAPGHNSTDYERYYSTPAGAGAIYKVGQYQSAYEPYVITSKRVSWFVSPQREAGNPCQTVTHPFLGGRQV